MTPVVIVSGLGGSGEAHWQTHLQRSLPNVTRVEQDDWEKPELTRWTERLAGTVETRPGAILVAHSLGCPLVAHLARQRPNLRIKGALLVAPADVDCASHTAQNPWLCPDFRSVRFGFAVSSWRAPTTPTLPSHERASWPPPGVPTSSMLGRLAVSTSRQASVLGPRAWVWSVP